MTRHIAMWSGPRNISTTMMRSFENRPDCSVVDEPFYAYYLNATGIVHPMQEEVLASQSRDWRHVVTDLVSDNETSVCFQKHMCQHMLPEIDLDWLADIDHFFLIRDPAQMVASYADRMGSVTPSDLGTETEWKIFQKVSALKGAPPPVVDAGDILADPEAVLKLLCEALNLDFYPEMLGWRAGPRDSDGIWGAHWYQSVWSSTGFRPKPEKKVKVSAEQQRVVEACAPHYAALHAHRLAAH